MGHFYGSQVHRSDLRLLIALFRAMLPLTVGGSITWLEPPPFETVTDTSRIYSTTKQVMQGSLNEELSWNFSLTADSSIAAVLLKFRGQPAVTLVPNQSPSVEPVFAEHFNVVWVPNKLTLILFNVTDAEKGEYCCEVVTMGMSSRSWMRKIQLLVLAPSPKVSSITDAQNPIQTTVSAFTASEGLIRTTESSLTASEADVPWGIIGAVVGAVDVAIVIGIAIVRFLKRRKHSQRSAGIPMQAPVSCALLEPLAADGINCNHSKMDIQEKKEDPSV